MIVRGCTGRTGLTNKALHSASNSTKAWPSLDLVWHWKADFLKSNLRLDCFSTEGVWRAKLLAQSTNLEAVCIYNSDVSWHPVTSLQQDDVTDHNLFSRYGVMLSIPDDICFLYNVELQDHKHVESDCHNLIMQDEVQDIIPSSITVEWPGKLWKCPLHGGLPWIERIKRNNEDTPSF